MKLSERINDKQRKQELSAPRPGSLGKWIALIVLLISLGFTFFVWNLVNDLTINRAQERFVFQTHTIETALHERLRAAEFLLQSGAALFAASGEVTREEWHTFVAGLDLEKYQSGVQGFGFARRILPSEKEAHIRLIRNEGFPDYDIKPAGERPEYSSIVFLEPFDWRNQRAFGYDMYSEPTRAAAMAKARDSGAAAMSGKVTLVQETASDVQAGFLVYLPVYRKGEAPENLDERRQALTGYVYSPFRVDDLVHQIMSENGRYVELKIYDGDEPREEALLYTYRNPESLLPESERQPLATHHSRLEYAGHDWLLVYDSSPLFDASIDTGSIHLILVLGIIVSLLLFVVLCFLTKSRNQALSLARASLSLERINRELEEEISERSQIEAVLRQNEHLLSESQRLGHIGSFRFEMTGDQQWSEELYRVFGVSRETFTLNQESFMGLIHPEDRQSMQEWIAACSAGEQPDALEFRIRKSDGTIRYIRGWGDLVVDAENRPLYLIGMGQDITERVRADQEIERYGAELVKRNKELESALSNIDQLTGMLPICASCKKIKDNAGYWQVVESYISTHTKAVFSHGLCPECATKARKELDLLNSGKPVKHEQPIRPMES